MLRRFLDWLLSVNYPSLNTRLSSMEERLDRIERQLKRQSRFAAIAFIYAAGFALIGIGWAIRNEFTQSAAVMMPFGYILVVLGGILSIIFLLRTR